MNEQLLQFIWQFQYFNRSDLQTTQGEEVYIITPGTWNKNQGPDFTNARIRIGNTEWAGTVEIHVKASDWQKHQHAVDCNYKNVILHVVYENDLQFSSIPVLELKGRIAISLLQRYTQLMGSSHFIACENLIDNISDITITSWKERLLIERLMRKTAQIQQYMAANQQHWEESFWWLLARNFGTKINADAFEAIAQSIPLILLAKHKHQLIQLEALLLGQAGLLEADFEDKYAQLLQREYRFLKIKYQLQPIVYPVYFLRMRPSNFPTVRLAQLAALIQQSAHLFSKIVAAPSWAYVKKWLEVTPNDFWLYHYTLTDEPYYKPKPLGAEMINNILINSIVPMLFAYGQAHQQEPLKYKAMQWLEAAKAEKNSITKGFEKIGFINKSAWDSQSLIELKNQYCNHKRCVACAIGSALIKP